MITTNTTIDSYFLNLAPYFVYSTWDAQSSFCPGYFLLGEREHEILSISTYIEFSKLWNGDVKAAGASLLILNRAEGDIQFNSILV